MSEMARGHFKTIEKWRPFCCVGPPYLFILSFIQTVILSFCWPMGRFPWALGSLPWALGHLLWTLGILPWARAPFSRAHVPGSFLGPFSRAHVRLVEVWDEGEDHAFLQGREKVQALVAANQQPDIQAVCM